MATTTTKLSITIETNGADIDIKERESGAVIATLLAGQDDYIIDPLAWTANLVSESPVDIGAELRALMTPAQCRLIAAMPAPMANL